MVRVVESHSILKPRGVAPKKDQRHVRIIDPREVGKRHLGEDGRPYQYAYTAGRFVVYNRLRNYHPGIDLLRTGEAHIGRDGRVREYLCQIGNKTIFSRL